MASVSIASSDYCPSAETGNSGWYFGTVFSSFQVSIQCMMSDMQRQVDRIGYSFRNYEMLLGNLITPYAVPNTVSFYPLRLDNWKSYPRLEILMNMTKS